MSTKAKVKVRRLKVANTSSNREYLTAISIDAGIITLIEPEGSIGYYRQRGIGRLKDFEIRQLISMGMLNPNWAKLKELPRNWSIEFEDEEIMGKARATFPIPKNMRR